MRLSLERLVWKSNLELVKSDTVLVTARRRCAISSKENVMLAGEMSWKWAPQTRNTLRRNTASERFDLNLVSKTFDDPFSFLN